jgi:hypothetical protein
MRARVSTTRFADSLQSSSWLQNVIFAHSRRNPSSKVHSEKPIHGSLNVRSTNIGLCSEDKNRAAASSRKFKSENTPRSVECVRRFFRSISVCKYLDKRGPATKDTATTIMITMMRSARQDCKVYARPMGGLIIAHTRLVRLIHTPEYFRRKEPRARPWHGRGLGAGLEGFQTL